MPVPYNLLSLRIVIDRPYKGTGKAIKIDLAGKTVGSGNVPGSPSLDLMILEARQDYRQPKIKSIIV